MRYQGCGGNSGRLFGIGHSNTYGRGQGHGFNPTKPNVRGECDALGIHLYSFRDARQAYMYTNMMESILNYIQGNFNKVND